MISITNRQLTLVVASPSTELAANAAEDEKNDQEHQHCPHCNHCIEPWLTCHWNCYTWFCGSISSAARSSNAGGAGASYSGSIGKGPLPFIRFSGN